MTASPATPAAAAQPFTAQPFTAQPFTAQTPEQARALLDPQSMSVLAAFAQPATPSEAARHLGQPANRTTYHVRRLLALSLLREAEQQGKRQRYQVVAHTFSVPYHLTAAAEVTDTFKPFFQELERQFASAARERAHELSEAQLEGAITLRLGDTQPLHTDPAPALLLRYALSADVQTLRLSAEEYAELQAELAALLARYSAKAASPQRRLCSAVRLLFPGALFSTAE